MIGSQEEDSAMADSKPTESKTGPVKPPVLDLKPRETAADKPEAKPAQAKTEQAASKPPASPPPANALSMTSRDLRSRASSSKRVPLVAASRLRARRRSAASSRSAWYCSWGGPR